MFSRIILLQLKLGVYCCSYCMYVVMSVAISLVHTLWLLYLLLQALKVAFPTGTFLKNGIVQGVKVSMLAANA